MTALASKTVTIPEDVLAVLSASTWDGDVLILPAGRLERPMYVAVNKALTLIGGAWNRKAGGHVFPTGADPQARFDALLETGTAVSAKAAGFFPTPPALTDRLIHHARLEAQHTVLEPSAGHGALADAIVAAGVAPWHVTLVELLPENARVLRDKGYEPIEGDFLDLGEQLHPVDRVVMNPPFERRADIWHVRAAFSYVKPGGRLVAIMAAGITFRQDAVTTAFLNDLVAPYGFMQENPDGAFAESGTMIRTVTVVLDKPLPEAA